LRAHQPISHRANPCLRIAWEDFSDLFREGAAFAAGLGGCVRPLRKGTVDDLVIVGQIGQSLDGRSRRNPDIRNISTDRGTVHLHRLRALMDAVVVGVATAIADDRN